MQTPQCHRPPGRITHRALATAAVASAAAAAPGRLADGVPVVDLSELVALGSAADITAEMAAVRHIREACSTWGFFQVVNHGVSNDDRKTNRHWNIPLAHAIFGHTFKAHLLECISEHSRLWGMSCVSSGQL